MTAVQDQVAMMFGEHVATVLADEGFLREDHGPGDDEGAVAPEFWRIYYRLDETMIQPVAGNNATLKIGGYMPAKIMAHLNDAFRALNAQAFPGQVSKPNRLYWYSANQSKNDVLANERYWTPERIAKFLDWKHTDFNTLNTAKGYYSKLRACPQVKCRLVGVIATEVASY
jgi:hypothetical protein